MSKSYVRNLSLNFILSWVSTSIVISPLELVLNLFWRSNLLHAQKWLRPSFHSQFNQIAILFTLFPLLNPFEPASLLKRKIAYFSLWILLMQFFISYLFLPFTLWKVLCYIHMKKDEGITLPQITPFTMAYFGLYIRFISAWRGGRW